MPEWYIKAKSSNLASFFSKEGKKVNTSSNSSLSFHALATLPYSDIASLTLRSMAAASPGPSGLASPTEETMNSSDAEAATSSTDQASANFDMKYTKPAQDKLKAKIDTRRNKIEQLQNFKTSGFA